jgi:hypothetical protein
MNTTGPAGWSFRYGHSRPAGSANRGAREQGWTVDHARRRRLGIVLREFRLHPLEVVLLDQNWDRDIDDAGRIMRAAITRAAHAVGPLACGIASVGQDLVHRPDAEGRAPSRAVAAISPWCFRLIHPMD